MIDNTKEYILCAAIKRKEPRDCQPYHPNTNDICNIELGYRHHDIFHRFDGEMSEWEQGGIKGFFQRLFRKLNLN